MDLLTSEIAKETGGMLSGADVEVSGATIDSRHVVSGQLFVPVVAARDGHDFVAAAVAGGAAAYLTSRGPVAGVDATAVEVGDTVDALSAVGRHARTRLPDKVLDTVRSAVVVQASPLGVEMVTALAHRGIETHLVDPSPWPMSEMADPDIMAPVEESWRELGVITHFNTTLKAFVGDGQLAAVQTSDGEIKADLAVVCTHKEPNTALAVAAGLKTGSTGGIIVDERMATSAPGIFAAGDCAEIPHGLTRVPLQGLTGSHAYAQGKAAGVNAGGGLRTYSAVYVPWGTAAGKWIIGGASFGETTATALGIPYVVGTAEGISRARYYPGVKPVKVKLLAQPGSLRLLGAQMVGGEGIKERADFLAMAVKFGFTLHDLARMENVYSPAIGALNEPIVVAAQSGLDAVSKN